MNDLLIAYLRLALRGLFLWLIAQGYLSQEAADSLMMDPDLARVIEITVSFAAWGVVELWHVWDAWWKKRKAPAEFEGEQV